MKNKAGSVGKLSQHQLYLLNRIPSKYQIRGDVIPMPDSVKQANKVIAVWEKKVSRIRCKNDRRAEALREKAREAVYFASPEKALAIIRQIEKMVKGCEE